jgi:hypothetical protein
MISQPHVVSGGFWLDIFDRIIELDELSMYTVIATPLHFKLRYSAIVSQLSLRARGKKTEAL